MPQTHALEQATAAAPAYSPWLANTMYQAPSYFGAWDISAPPEHVGQPAVAWLSPLPCMSDPSYPIAQTPVLPSQTPRTQSQVVSPSPQYRLRSSERFNMLDWFGDGQGLTNAQSSLDYGGSYSSSQQVYDPHWQPRHSHTQGSTHPSVRSQTSQQTEAEETPQPSRKRRRVDDGQETVGGMQHLHPSSGLPTVRSYSTPSEAELHRQPHTFYRAQSSQPDFQPDAQLGIAYQPAVFAEEVDANAAQQQLHHHRLPTQFRLPRSQSIGYQGSDATSVAEESNPYNVVGQPGMPSPAPRPKGPKLKFTAEDDALLIRLKETKNLTWKQIADFFPGRSSGTLQVRYCTKLKAKTTLWDDEMTQRLRAAIHDYDTNRWRWIATKVGHGLSPAACRDKALELDQQGSEQVYGVKSGAELEERPSEAGSGDDNDDGGDDDGSRGVTSRALGVIREERSAERAMPSPSSSPLASRV